VLIEKFHPATFAERGVAVPFTTPMLIGSRARPDEREGIELIVPNPGGGQGVYVFNWSQLTKFCQPSLHDLAMTERVGTLKLVTPATIRRVAREVAAEGLAGREVALAADRAWENEQQSSLLTNFNLLVGLMRQIETPDPLRATPERETPLRMQRRAQQTIAAFAPQIGLPPEQVAIHLEELADICLRVGVGNGAAAAFLPQLVRELRRFQRGLAEWAAVREGDRADLARYIVSEAGATLGVAEPMIAANQQRALNVVQLLRDYVLAPAKLSAEFARSDWLLDGWQLLCVRWRAASPEEYDDVIEDLAAMLPPMPTEVMEWGYMFGETFERNFRRKVQAGHDWRSGLLAFQGIERGEEALRLVFDVAAE